MAGADVESFYATHQALYKYLLDQSEPTFASAAGDNFRRALVLAIASHFETEVTEIVREMPRRHAASHPLICGMIEQRVIARQYHSYFDWEGKNANKFFSMFGADFSETAKAAVGKDAKLNQSIRDFLELGNTRNRLVHLNYVAFDLDKTPEEIIELFRSAQGFIKYTKRALLDTMPPAAPAAT